MRPLCFAHNGDCGTLNSNEKPPWSRNTADPYSNDCRFRPRRCIFHETSASQVQTSQIPCLVAIPTFSVVCPSIPTHQSCCPGDLQGRSLQPDESTAYILDDLRCAISALHTRTAALGAELEEQRKLLSRKEAVERISPHREPVEFASEMIFDSCLAKEFESKYYLMDRRVAGCYRQKRSRPYSPPPWRSRQGMRPSVISLSVADSYAASPVSHEDHRPENQAYPWKSSHSRRPENSEELDNYDKKNHHAPDLVHQSSTFQQHEIGSNTPLPACIQDESYYDDPTPINPPGVPNDANRSPNDRPTDSPGNDPESELGILRDILRKKLRKLPSKKTRESETAVPSEENVLRDQRAQRENGNDTIYVAVNNQGPVIVESEIPSANLSSYNLYELADPPVEAVVSQPPLKEKGKRHSHGQKSPNKKQSKNSKSKKNVTQGNNEPSTKDTSTNTSPPNTTPPTTTNKSKTSSIFSDFRDKEQLRTESSTNLVQELAEPNVPSEDLVCINPTKIKASLELESELPQNIEPQDGPKGSSSTYPINLDDEEEGAVSD